MMILGINCEDDESVVGHFFVIINLLKLYDYSSIHSLSYTTNFIALIMVAYLTETTAVFNIKNLINKH